MDTFSKEEYDRGYKDGINDGQKVSPENYHYKILTGNSYNDGYATGYNQSFRKKQNSQKKKTIINTSNHINTQNIMVEMSLETQLRRVSDFKEHIKLTIRQIEILKYDMQTKLEFLLANGLTVEIEQEYKTHYLNPLYSRLDIIGRRILNDDMGYLNDVEVLLKEAKNKQ